MSFAIAAAAKTAVVAVAVAVKPVTDAITVAAAVAVAARIAETAAASKTTAVAAVRGRAVAVVTGTIAAVPKIVAVANSIFITPANTRFERADRKFTSAARCYGRFFALCGKIKTPRGLFRAGCCSCCSGSIVEFRGNQKRTHRNDCHKNVPNNHRHPFFCAVTRFSDATRCAYDRKKNAVDAGDSRRHADKNEKIFEKLHHFLRNATARQARAYRVINGLQYTLFFSLCQAFEKFFGMTFARRFRIGYGMIKFAPIWRPLRLDGQPLLRG